MILAVRNPYSDELVAELERDEAGAQAQKVARAVSAQRGWGELGVAERVGSVRKALEYFRRHQEEVVADVTRQMGKPLAQSRGELAGMFERAEHMLAIAESSLAPQVLPEKAGFLRRIDREPWGVVLNIAAWNYPLFLPFNVVVPALLAGNTVLLKHSRRTPLCGVHFERAFADVLDLPVVQHLILDHASTAELIQHPAIAYVAFTGSVSGGLEVERAAGGRVLDLGLELGGKDPAYVAADVDLEATVAGIVDGACYNAGQSCCAVERVYVHQSRYDEFLERAQVLLGHYRMGDPLDPETTLGPLADRGAVSFLAGQVQDARKRGARLLCGGHSHQERFFEPTLLADCPNDAQVMQEESFGPLVPVQSVADDAQALERMNDSRFGLTASVWTQDPERAEWFARRLQAGTIYQNRCDFLDPALPWTGWRDSGLGSTLSPLGFHHLTRPKSIHFRRSLG